MDAPETKQPVWWSSGCLTDWMCSVVIDTANWSGVANISVPFLLIFTRGQMDNRCLCFAQQLANTSPANSFKFASSRRSLMCFVGLEPVAFVVFPLPFSHFHPSSFAHYFLCLPSSPSRCVPADTFSHCFTYSTFRQLLAPLQSRPPLQRTLHYCCSWFNEDLIFMCVY